MRPLEGQCLVDPCLVSKNVVCFLNVYLLINKYISDSKRQQTTTVDNKRLINGFFLTKVASLRHETFKH